MADVEEIIGLANALLRREPENAAAKYAEAVKAAPADERGYCGMALALKFAGRYRESAACMEELLKIRPGAAYAHGLIGDAAENEGRKEDALASYERMLEIDPDDMAARFRREIVMNAGGAENAERGGRVLDAEQDDPVAETTRKIMASAVLKTGGPSSNDSVVMTPGMRQAMDVLFAWSTEDGFLGYAYPHMYGGPSSESRGQMLERANELADAGRFAEAAKAADAAIDAYPDFADAYSAKASFLTEMEKYREAAACVDQILRIRPDDTDDLGVKGMLLEKIGLPAEAAACYDRIIEINPGDMTSRYFKCGLLAATGDARGLAECYRRALEAEPDGEKSASMQRGMRREYRELSRRAESAGSIEAGFAKFMRRTGVGVEPKWGRGYAGGAGSAPPRSGRIVRTGRRR